MISKYSLQTQGILFALFAMLTFSINDGIFKFAMLTTSPQMAVFLGYLCSTLFLFTYTAARKIDFLPHRKRNGVILGILFVLEQVTFIYALKHLPIAELFVVVLASPVCVVVMSSVILKEHLMKREVLAVILGFAGALLVVSAPLFFGNSGSSASGVEKLAWISAVLNVLFNSSKIIYLRKYCQQENTFSLSIFANAFVLIFFGLFISPSDFHIDLWPAILLLMGGIMAGYGCTLYVRSFQLAKAPLVSATQYSQILWTSLMGVFIFYETLTIPGAIGIILILVSGYLLYFKKKL